MFNKTLTALCILMIPTLSMAHGISSEIVFYALGGLVSFCMISLVSIVKVFLFTKKSKNKIKTFLLTLILSFIFISICTFLGGGILVLIDNIHYFNQKHLFKEIICYVSPFLIIGIYLLFYNKVFSKLANI